MNKCLLLALFACIAAIAGPSAAQQAGPASDSPSASATAVQHRLYRGSKIIGSTVRDPQENKIGVIRDLMLDSRRGEIAYVVISFGGVASSGRKYHAVPWQALEASDDGKSYVLRADAETVANAPGFDRRRWPDMADQAWSAAIDRYWSAAAGGARPGDQLAAPGVSTPHETSGR